MRLVSSNQFRELYNYDQNKAFQIFNRRLMCKNLKKVAEEQETLSNEHMKKFKADIDDMWDFATKHFESYNDPTKGLGVRVKSSLTEGL